MRERIIKKKVLTIIGLCGLISKKGCTLLSSTANGRIRQMRDMKERGWIREKTVEYIVKKRGRMERRKERIYVLKNPKIMFGEYEGLMRIEEKEVMDSHERSQRSGGQFRGMRQSELLVMMLEIGADISGEGDFGYIMAHKIKRGMEEEMEMTYDTESTISSRAYGTLYRRGTREMYGIYDLWYGDCQVTYRKSEMAYMISAGEYIFGRGYEGSYQRIVMIKNYGIIVPLLKRRIGVGKFREYQTFLHGSAYQTTLVAPKSREGVMILYVITMENAKKRLDRYAGVPLEKSKSIQCDGVQKKGGINVYVLNFLYPDLNRLDAFLAAAEMDGGKNRYRIVAYEESAAAIQGLVKKIEIVEHSVQDVYDHFMAADLI